MRNTFGPSRSMLALAIALAGLAGGCNDSGGPRDNQQDAPASAPQNVFVPALSADENSLVLVWEKPESETQQVVDYAIYRQGEQLGLARENQNHFSPAKPYIDNFYQRRLAAANRLAYLYGHPPGAGYGIRIYGARGLRQWQRVAG